MGNNYLVLSRKYRPSNIEEVVGQNATKKIIKNSFELNRVPHAIILNGIRGVGKTTLARIIAQVLNCSGRSSTDPAYFNCGKCVSCDAIRRGDSPDVFEMDAASYTGVQDIREVIENSRYRPISSPHKIFIIDEVHMLSNNAFNAMLKTLEEPPSYVKFILATTEIKKIPLTILSRCQKLNLSRISTSELYSYFVKIVVAEGIMAEDEALEVVARMADGSLRDGLSILDQIIAVCSIVNRGNREDHGGDIEYSGSSGGKITLEIVKDVLNIFDEGIVCDILCLALQGEILQMINLLHEHYYYNSLDIDYFLEIVLEIIKKATLLKEGGGSQESSKKIIDESICMESIMRSNHESMDNSQLKSNFNRSDVYNPSSALAFENFFQLVNVPILFKMWGIFTECIKNSANSYNKLSHVEMGMLQVSQLDPLSHQKNRQDQLPEKMRFNSDLTSLDHSGEKLNIGGEKIDYRNLNDSGKNLNAKIENDDNDEKNSSEDTTHTRNFEDFLQKTKSLLAKISDSGDMLLYSAIYNDLVLVSFDDDKKIITLEENYSTFSVDDIANRLSIVMGERWTCIIKKNVLNQKRKLTINELIEKEKSNLQQSLLQQPLIKDIISEWSMKVEKVELN